MTDRIKAGAARSSREVSIYTSTHVVCPKHQGLVPYGVDKSPTGAVAMTNCPICNAHVEVEFSAGPGWDNDPNDPFHLASGDAASTLLPESYFRGSIERGARRVRGASDPGRAAASAADVILDLLEIRKLHRTAGSDLSKSDLDVLAEAAQVMVNAGETLTEDVAVLARTRKSP